jgi:hypothetical protein
MDSWDSAVGRSPAARRLLTISERPMRERSAGTAMAAGGARSGGGSLVTKRTRTWREASASMAATADGRAARKWWGSAWRRREGSGKGFGSSSRGV